MLSSSINSFLCAVFAITATVEAQTASTSQYVGYNLTLEGDGDSVVYSTYDTNPNAAANDPAPDVYLNATVHVGEIDLVVVLTVINRYSIIGQRANCETGQPYSKGIRPLYAVAFGQLC